MCKKLKEEHWKICKGNYAKLNTQFKQLRFSQAADFCMLCLQCGLHNKASVAFILVGNSAFGVKLALF